MNKFRGEEYGWSEKLHINCWKFFMQDGIMLNNYR